MSPPKLSDKESVFAIIPPSRSTANLSDSSIESPVSNEDDPELEVMLSREDAQIVDLLHRPRLDPQSRELATLNSLLLLIQNTPANGSLAYQLFPNFAPHCVVYRARPRWPSTEYPFNGHHHPWYVQRPRTQPTLLCPESKVSQITPDIAFKWHGRWISLYGGSRPGIQRRLCKWFGRY